MWNGCRVGRLWTNSSYVHIAWTGRCYWCLMQYEVVISLSCAVQIRYNGDGGSALIFVCCMYRTVSCCPWTNSVCVCVAWIGRRALWVFDALWGRNNLTIMHALSKYITMAMTASHWSPFVECRCRVGPGWTGRTFVYCCVCATIWHVLLVFDTIWCHNSILMLCCPNTLK